MGRINYREKVQLLKQKGINFILILAAMNHLLTLFIFTLKNHNNFPHKKARLQ